MVWRFVVPFLEGWERGVRVENVKGKDLGCHLQPLHLILLAIFWVLITPPVTPGCHLDRKNTAFFERGYQNKTKILHVEVRGSQRKYHLGVISRITWMCAFLMTPWVTPNSTRQRLVNTWPSLYEFFCSERLWRSTKSKRERDGRPHQPRIQACRLQHVTTHIVLLCLALLNRLPRINLISPGIYYTT